MPSIAKFDIWQNTAGTPQTTIVGYGSYFYPSVNDNYVSIASNTEYDTSVSVTYTPKFSTSILVVQAAIHTRLSPAYGMSMGIKRDGAKQLGNFNLSASDFFYKGGTTNNHKNMHATIRVNANATTATTFSIWIRPYEGIGEWSQGWGQAFIQVWEIQA